MGGGGRGRSGRNVGRGSVKLPYAVVLARRPAGWLCRRRLCRPCGGGNGGHRSRTDGGDKGGVAPANRVDGLCSGQGETGASAPPGARHLLHRQFGDNASDGGIGLLAAAHEAAGVWASSNAARSAARATLRAFIRASRPRGSTSCAGRSS